MPWGELSQYDVIITSYQFVLHQHKKLRNYLNEVQAKEANPAARQLTRPNLNILSDMFSNTSIKSPYLVLDEMTAIKNSKGPTFAAIERLRQSADTVIMLSGTPIDNQWVDILSAIKLLGNEHINTKAQMYLTFGHKTTNPITHKTIYNPPTGKLLCRLVQRWP